MQVMVNHFAKVSLNPVIQKISLLKQRKKKLVFTLRKEMSSDMIID